VHYTIRGALKGDRRRDVVRRSTILGVVSFLTLIDLFGSQALLPRLVVAFEADAGTMGFAVNAATIGMAVSGLIVAWFADRIDRKRGIWVSLACLSVPTLGLGLVDDVTTFTLLRIAQGVFMAAAFTLTMTYLSEQCDVTAAGGAMAAYVTGNVASNLFGRMMAVSTADGFGLSGSFFAFAGLNLAGAAVAFVLIGPKDDSPPTRSASPAAAWRRHLSHPSLRAAFAIGCAILFVFVGVFTYVNLHLTAALGVPEPALGLVYVVFVPAMVTTLYAAKAVGRWGPQSVFRAAGTAALVGISLTLVPTVAAVLAGLAIVGAALFFMQAAATGFVGRTAQGDRAVANGLYLTSYYVGGLLGALALGQAQLAGGWPMVAGIVALVVVATLLLAGALRHPGPPVLPRRLTEAGATRE